MTNGIRKHGSGKNRSEKPRKKEPKQPRKPAK